MKPISAKRQALNKERKRILEEHFGPRDEWHCTFHDYAYGFRDEIDLTDFNCFGFVNAHEILKRSRSRKDSNLLDVEGVALLCDFHNGWVERFPDLSHEMGLAKHSWEILD